MVEAIYRERDAQSVEEERFGRARSCSKCNGDARKAGAAGCSCLVPSTLHSPRRNRVHAKFLLHYREYTTRDFEVVSSNS